MLAGAFTGLLGFIFFVPIFYLAGSLAAGQFAEDEDVVSQGIVFSAVGMGILAAYLVLAGSLHRLYPSSIVFFGFVTALLGRRRAPLFLNWLRCLGATLFGKPASFLEQMLQIALGVGFILGFLLCFVPETAGDALVYQLNIPKLFALKHSIQPLAYDFNSYMPMLMNLLYTVGMSFQSVPLAKLFHWWTGLLLVSFLILLVGRENKNKGIGLFMGAVLWFTPTFLNQVATTYVDVGLAFFAFLSFYFLMSAFKSAKPAHFFLSGLFLGCAISTKFIYLISGAGYAGLFLLSGTQPCFRGRFFKSLVLCGLGCTIGCAFWLVRNEALTGDPLFPFLSPFYIGSEGKVFMGNYASYGVPKTLFNFLLTPWNLTFHAYYVHSGFWPGPFYLLLLPFVLTAVFKNKDARNIFIFVVLYSLVAFFAAQRERYLLPLFPLYLLLGASGLCNLSSSVPNSLRICAKITGLGCLLFLMVLGVYHFRLESLILAGRWSQEEYLENRERTYPIAQWMNKNLSPESKTLMLFEVRQFYFQRELIRERFFHRLTHYTQIKDPAALAEFLKSKGITHILKAELERDNALHVPNQSALQKLLGQSDLSELVTTIRSENRHDERYLYHLYQLK